MAAGVTSDARLLRSSDSSESLAETRPGLALGVLTFGIGINVAWISIIGWLSLRLIGWL